jgi:hypothetical protein
MQNQKAKSRTAGREGLRYENPKPETNTKT